MVLAGFVWCLLAALAKAEDVRDTSVVCFTDSLWSELLTDTSVLELVSSSWELSGGWVARIDHSVLLDIRKWI